MQENKAHLVWIVLAAIGIVLLIISAFAGIDQLKKAKGEAEMISDLPVIDYADFNMAESGSLIVITGILQPASEASRSDDLIIYYEQTWNVDSDDEDDWTGQWQRLVYIFPCLMADYTHILRYLFL